MALTMEYPVISSNLSSGYGVFGTADPYNSAALNNGALNPVGALYFQPAASMGGNTLLSTSKGYAAGLWCRYVLYKSTANPAMVAGPAPVYYTDETFTTVSGVFSEGNPSATGSSASTAGFLLPNTGTVAGVGVGTAVSATILNNGGNGSYVWIGVQGWIPSAYMSGVGGINYAVYGSSGNFAVTGVAMGGTAFVQLIAGYTISTVSSSIADVKAVLPLF